MKKIMSRLSLLLSVTILFGSTSSGIVSARGALSYPTDPTSNIAWSAGFSGVADIQAAFNNGRTKENTQLGKSIPMLTMPSQAAWDAKTDSEKALWLINRERIDRGIMPLDNVEANVTSVAQYFADYLRTHNAFDHNADGRSPWDRLNANAAIGACHDFLGVAENLAAFMTSGTDIPLPVERAVYNWTYDDSGSAWGHRHANLWYPYNDNSGTSGQEGFIGIGRSSGPYQGWNYGVVVVMNVFDPCATWIYSNSGWTSLGKPSSAQLFSCPGVGTNQDGRLEVFAVGSDNALWTSWENTTNGSWSGWESKGKPTGVSLYLQPAVGANQFGGQEVFVAGGDGAIWHLWQAAVNDGWSSSWSTFGKAGTSLGYPAAGMNSDGRQEIFATNVDGNIYHISQTAPNSGWNSWSSMGKPSGVALYGPIAVGWNHYGGMEIYAHGGDGNMWHIWQTGSGWSTWSSLGKPSALPYLGDAAASSNADGRQEIFSSGGDGSIWHRWQTSPNGGWNSDWVSMGKPSGLQSIYSAAIGKTTDGRMDVFSFGSDNAIWHKWQIAANDGWSNDWISLGKPSGVDLQCYPVVRKEANGQLTVFSWGNNNEMWFYRVTPTFPIIAFYELYLPFIKK